MAPRLLRKAPPVPEQDAFLDNGVTVLAPPVPNRQAQSDCCMICFYGVTFHPNTPAFYTSPEGGGKHDYTVVRAKACPHFFHRHCLKIRMETLNDDRGLCPACRTPLFEPDPLTVEQSIDLQRKTREAQRLAKMTAEEILIEMATEEQSRAERPTSPWDPSRLVPFSITRYGVHIPEFPETDRYARLHINAYCRTELQALEQFVGQGICEEIWLVEEIGEAAARLQIPSKNKRRLSRILRPKGEEAGHETKNMDTTDPEVNWIRLVDWTEAAWYREGCPLTDYTTDPNLERLTITAAVINGLYSHSNGSYTNCVAFSHLLAYAERLLLQAMKTAREREGGPNLEERRLFERSDCWWESNGPGPDHYRDNMPRIKWIVNLRKKTRGINTGYYGPGSSYD